MYLKQTAEQSVETAVKTGKKISIKGKLGIAASAIIAAGAIVGGLMHNKRNDIQQEEEFQLSA